MVYTPDGGWGWYPSKRDFKADRQRTVEMFIKSLEVPPIDVLFSQLPCPHQQKRQRKKEKILEIPTDMISSYYVLVSKVEVYDMHIFGLRRCWQEI